MNLIEVPGNVFARSDKIINQMAIILEQPGIYIKPIKIAYTPTYGDLKMVDGFTAISAINGKTIFSIGYITGGAVIEIFNDRIFIKENQESFNRVSALYDKMAADIYKDKNAIAAFNKMGRYLDSFIIKNNEKIK